MKKGKKPKNDTRPQEIIGMNRVSSIVQGRAKHGWQAFDKTNDDGIDGIIIKRKNGEDTGEIIYVQVKCGDGYYKEAATRPEHFGVLVGEDYISSHRARWERLSSAVILVYVNFKTEEAWWTDLRSEETYTPDNKSIILVPKHQRFGVHSFNEFRKLKGYLHINHDLMRIVTEKDDVRYFNFTENSIKDWARKFYKEWAKSEERTNPIIGEVIVSREGWRHIVRRGRKPERIIQSWLLLGVAKRIIQEAESAYRVRRDKSIECSDGSYVIIDYLALRANVSFSYRHSSIVQVILKRKRIFDKVNKRIEVKTWFYSVFEPFNQKFLR